MTTQSRATGSKSAAKSSSKKPAAKSIASQKPVVHPDEEQAHLDRRATDKPKNGIGFSAMQLTAPTIPQGAQPAAKPAAPQQNAEFMAAVAALAAQFGVAVPALKQSQPRAEREQQHGITRPAQNTKCGLIWAAADQITAETDSPCTIGALRSHPDVANVNEHTIRTQYARWRQYNGISGRLATPAPAAE